MKIKLNHIGLNIQSKTELVNFYQNILGFHLEHQFELNSAFASNIFGIEKQPEVFYYKNESLYFELFVYPENTTQGFAHICLEVIDRELIAEKCKNKGYQVTRIRRNDKLDILFIRDKAGNIFELKKWSNENVY
jgi:catechol 2,3-dioxygenase-like lactoylglutathione lyase family enzyme